MRFSIAFLGLLALAAAVPRQLTLHAANQDLLRKQQDVLNLLENIYGDLPYPHLYEIGSSYNLEANLQNYDNPMTVSYYGALLKSGHVQPKRTPFSFSVSQLRKEVALLTQTFLGAKDYQTFLSTAAYARIHVNEDQFVTAFASAVLQREDTNGVTLPPVYEIYPHYFFDSRIIQKVYDHINRCNEESQSPSSQSGTYKVYANYTSHFPYGENRIAYFTDDIGLSSYYFYVQLASYMLPRDSNIATFKKNQFNYKSESREGGNNAVGHGAHYYYIHQQLLARYNLERLRQRLSPIRELDFYYHHIETPYIPNLRSSNGVDFPGRDENIHITPRSHHYQLAKLISTLEHRIVDSINLGYVATPQSTYLSLYQPEGLNILGELIEGTGRSINPRFYGSFQAAAREFFGQAPEFNNIFEFNPSILELGQTAVRDPIFYELYNKIIEFFHHYQESLPAYEYNDINVPGVNIQKVDVSDLVTYFSDFEVSLNNAVPHAGSHENHSSHRANAYLKRLDHKQYQYSIYVNSNKVIPGAVVRVYVGPKYDYNGQPIDISVHRHYFFEIDQFFYDLAEGQNVIVRNSEDATGQSFDFPSFEYLKNQVHNAINSANPHYVNYAQQLYGFPARLSLPKGSSSGFPLQFFVVISSEAHRQPESYGPVIEAEYNTYQQQHYRVVQPEEYNSRRNQQESFNSVYQSAEVIPDFERQSITNGNGYADLLYNRFVDQGSYVDSYHRIHSRHFFGGSAQEQSNAGNYHHNSHGFTHGHEHQNSGSAHQHQTSDVVGSEHEQGSFYDASQGSSNNKFYGNQEGAGHASFDKNREGIQSQGGYHYPGHGGGYSAGRSNTQEGHNYQSNRGHDENLHNHYQNKFIGNIIGGAISLDGRPLGYPLDRHLSPSAFNARNIYVQDVLVYHIDDYFTEN